MPGSRPGIPLDEDVLRGGAGRSNGVDGFLVQIGDESVIFVVKLVVRVEYDLAVGRVPLCHRRPPRAETVYVGDDVVVIAPEVMRVDDGVGAPIKRKAILVPPRANLFERNLMTVRAVGYVYKHLLSGDILYNLVKASGVGLIHTPC